MSRKYIDLTGKVFGRLTVVSKTSIMGVRAHWNCKCKCGNNKIIISSSLIRGFTKSCGCILKETPPGKKHGGYGTRENRIWNHIRERCNNPKNHNYFNYGGRGISVCQHWDKYENFIKDMGSAPSTNHSIERINNEGNYEPSNCIWATTKEQCNNKRTNHLIKYNGETLTISQWCDKLNLNYVIVSGRIVNGWTPERAFTEETKRIGSNSLFMT